MWIVVWQSAVYLHRYAPTSRSWDHRQPQEMAYAYRLVHPSFFNRKTNRVVRGSSRYQLSLSARGMAASRNEISLARCWGRMDGRVRVQSPRRSGWRDGGDTHPSSSFSPCLPPFLLLAPFPFPPPSRYYSFCFCCFFFSSAPS